MKHQTFEPKADQELSTAPTTLADVLSHLATDPTLSPTRRRDLRSAVRGMGRILGVSLDAIPASPRVIRQRLKGLEPAQAGLSPKRFANIKSDVLAALRVVGAVDRPVNRSRPMAPAWDRLWHRIDVWEDAPGNVKQHSMCRFPRGRPRNSNLFDDSQLRRCTEGGMLIQTTQTKSQSVPAASHTPSLIWDQVTVHAKGNHRQFHPVRSSDCDPRGQGAR